MTLGEIVEKMIPSDRLIVTNSDKAELYRGYVENFRYSTADRSHEVAKIQLATDIFLKKNREKELGSQKVLTPQMPVESISDYAFSDLEILIFTKITLED